MTVATEPKVLFRDLLIAEWNPANTSGITPYIGFGFEPSSRREPCLLLHGTTESAQGASGYSAIRPDGSGGVQTLVGQTFAEIWTQRGITGQDAWAGISPRLLGWQMMEEARRIVVANAVNVAGVETLHVLFENEPDPEKKGSEVRFRRSITFGTLRIFPE